jgi:hypothetical protein
MRYAATLLLAIHAVAHLAGFAVNWKLFTSAEVPYRTTIVLGGVDIGDVGTRLLGLCWLGLALGFMVLAGAAWLGSASWPRWAFIAVVLSSVVCLAAWRNRGSAFSPTVFSLPFSPGGPCLI